MLPYTIGQGLAPSALSGTPGQSPQKFLNVPSLREPSTAAASSSSSDGLPANGNGSGDPQQLAVPQISVAGAPSESSLLGESVARSRRGSLTPSLRLETASIRREGSHNWQLLNHARDVVSQIIDQLTAFRKFERDDDDTLTRIESELASRAREVEAHISQLKKMRERVAHYNGVLEQENVRSKTEYAVKLQKIDEFCTELDVVADLERRLKKATDRVEDYKSRMVDIRNGIKSEKERLIDYERRTTSQRSILWSCLSVGALACGVGYSIYLYKARI
ncbi:hypothetical protein BZA70DRAFT_271791 [Myxozyma melibiosi]|uniref:Uncharacterized protein n=1 Tax=Myxozyma melibiosi TaxID=54550 RepID=A0ABR1FCN9_9ASCO